LPASPAGSVLAVALAMHASFWLVTMIRSAIVADRAMVKRRRAHLIESQTAPDGAGTRR